MCNAALHNDLPVDFCIRLVPSSPVDVEGLTVVAGGAFSGPTRDEAVFLGQLVEAVSADVGEVACDVDDGEEAWRPVVKEMTNNNMFDSV